MVIKVTFRAVDLEKRFRNKKNLTIIVNISWREQVE